MGGMVDEIEALQKLINGQKLNEEHKEEIQYIYWNWFRQNRDECENDGTDYNDDEADESDESDEEEFYTELDKTMKESLEKYEKADSWRKYTVEQLKADRQMWIVQTKKVTCKMTDGFLPISLLKYQLQRLVILRMWKRIETTSDLVPIGVKTDCIFVADRKAGKTQV